MSVGTMLWELTHACLEHPGPAREPAQGACAASHDLTDLLYPFIEGDDEDEALGRALWSSAHRCRSEGAKS